MHFTTSFSLCLFLSTSSAFSRYAIKRQDGTSLTERSVQYGWSLQSQTCPGGSESCDVGACCPSNLYCNPPGNAQVAACCPEARDCRGEADGAARCADSSWSLWQGMHGNLFCCEVGKVGVYNNNGPRAGTCVEPGNTGDQLPAVIKSTGAGGSPTSPPQTTTRSSSVTSVVTTTTSSMPGSTGKPIFFHYMIGTITDAHCEKDIRDAKALGADAFALNINALASWATDTTALLFKWAESVGFKLFFSFDMTGFNHPNQFRDFLNGYVTHPAYYHYKGLPFVSTFNGGTNSFGHSNVNEGWKVELQDAMTSFGHPIYFIPAFQDTYASSDFFTTRFPTLNGAFNWQAWPKEEQGKIIVPTTDDDIYIQGAHSAGKTFMMGVSPLQFKNMDSNNNWYLRGEQNLEYRLGQVLSLQPDFIELITWNDAGESHYMGNSWPEPIAGSTIPAYTDGYDHTAYKEILPAFFKAYKAGDTNTNAMFPTNGKSVQGTFWHHTLLAGGSCGGGKPRGAQNIEDTVTVIILVAQGTTSYSVNILSAGRLLGTKALVPGFNQYSVGGMGVGNIEVTVTNGGTVVVRGSGPLAVTNSANICNYNYQVVGLA